MRFVDNPARLRRQPGGGVGRRADAPQQHALLRQAGGVHRDGHAAGVVEGAAAGQEVPQALLVAGLQPPRLHDRDRLN